MNIIVINKEYENLNWFSIEGSKDILKSYFEKKNASCIMDMAEKEITYKFIDYIHSRQIDIEAIFFLNYTSSKLQLIIRNNEEVNKYDLEDYCNKIAANIFFKLSEGSKKYIIRFYAKYYSMNELDLNAFFNWKNNISISTHHFEDRNQVFNANSITNSPHEQMLFLDIEVSAFDISSARTIAYNRVREFYTFLSVLLDLSIYDFVSEQVISLVDFKDKLTNVTKFATSFVNKGFYDSELDLFVYDNLNGLIAFDNDRMVENNYLSYTFDCGTKSKVIVDSKYNEKLDKIFSNHKLVKLKKFYPKKALCSDILYYNSGTKISSAHINFFRKLKDFEEKNGEKYEYFANSCKIYNRAISICANEPTMMISYLIVSIDALLKTERALEYLKKCKSDMDKFISFCKKYNVEEVFDVDFFKYLYGNIRSGHFHSGEFKFCEYNTMLNQTFNTEFFEMRDNVYFRAKKIIRQIFIQWIEKNIIES